MYPPSIQKAIEQFSRFPTIGQRTASRFAFYILKASPAEVKELIAAIHALKKDIQLCRFCFSPFQISPEHSPLCEICRNTTRNTNIVCVVEKENDLESIEKTNLYKGLYFVLGGTVHTLRKEDIRAIRAQELKERLANPKEFGIQIEKFQELLIATNPTPEGEATGLYIERLMEPLHIPVTRLGRGLPIGAELEYADEETLKNALEGRR